MLWTLDSLRGHSEVLAPDAERARTRDPLSAFYRRLDLMVYVAAVGLAACLMAILVG